MDLPLSERRINLPPLDGSSYEGLPSWLGWQGMVHLVADVDNDAVPSGRYWIQVVNLQTGTEAHTRKPVPQQLVKLQLESLLDTDEWPPISVWFRWVKSQIHVRPADDGVTTGDRFGGVVKPDGRYRS